MGIASGVRQRLLRLDADGGADSSVVGWLLMAPVIILYSIAILTPVVFALYTSLFDIPLASRNWEFVAFQNYSEAFTIYQFWASVGRTLVYMVGSTAFQIVLGVGAALTLNKLRRGNRIITALVLNGYLIPTIVVALISLFMFNRFVGILHITGSQILGLWDGFVFGQPIRAMVALIFISGWKFSVFITIFVLAQRQSIPNSFYESAKICGASTWEMFRDITFPRIKGALLVAVFLRSIFMFNKFDIIWMLTEGGPGYATTTLPVLMYRQAFINGTYGLANAVAALMFLILLVFGVLYFRLFRPAEEVETQA